MTCSNCDSDFIIVMSAKCGPTFQATGPGINLQPDYVPGGLGIGDGDTFEIKICGACGFVPINHEELVAQFKAESRP